VQVWVRDGESFEAVTQDELVRPLVLRLAGLARRSRLPVFIATVGSDEELDAETKAAVLDLARNETFLLAGGGLPCVRPRTCTRPVATMRPLGRLAQLVRAPL
jgi:hypothetical protein